MLMHAARRFFLSIICVFLINGFATHAKAEVRLPKIFGSHMVLQQDKPVMVWGWAQAGEEVTVHLGDASSKATANGKGEWKASLPPVKAGGSPLTMTITASNTITFDDVLVGEVWLCSGQSNMEFGIRLTIDAQKEIADANESDLRLMKVGKDWKPTPQADITGQWQVCSPATVSQGGWGGFSAVAYFFGKNLHKQLGVPIGLIDASWGGTVIQSWTAPEGFAAVPALKAQNDLLQLGIAGTTVHNQQLNQAIDADEAWIADARKSITAGTLVPARPAIATSLFGPDDVQSSTALFNAMIHPLCPFAIRGAIWYQGEANVNEGKLYTERMKALIGGWRTIWGEGDFPFYFVQIAPFNYGVAPTVLPQFWAAQAAAEQVVPNTGMIVVNDIGNLGDIHPKNKQEVGRRLAVRALQDTYGKSDVVGHSPTFKSMVAEGSALRVTFDNAGTGLASRVGQPINWFEIADADEGGFVKADAKIDGASVLLSAPSVKTPVAVRFAWNMFAVPNLMNSGQLPVSAFKAGGVPVQDSISKGVPEFKDYTLVYDLNLAKLGRDIKYDVDSHASIKQPFDRIAYAMELVTKDGSTQWVYVSAAAFTDNPAKIGVPTVASGEHFQTNLSSLNVYTNVPGIVTGTNLDGGNIEFWPNDYSVVNGAHVPNASDGEYDFGDEPAEPTDGYGSMQIHNHDAKQTLFSVNDWREGDHADIGIGSAPTGNTDWTYARNADDCETKRLRVFVHLK